MIAALRNRLEKTAYVTRQLCVLAPLVLFHRAIELLVDRGLNLPDAQSLRSLRQRYEELLARDLENVKQGRYPKELLFQLPLASYVMTLPSLLPEIARMAWRRASRNVRDLPEKLDLSRYPSYFRQNFHWQSDGYLSLRSAGLYDLGVEILFLGTADIMRRQVIPPLASWLPMDRPGKLRLLDVGCGTGRTLLQLAAAYPRLRLFGVDLSPYYLQFARQLLADVPDVSLIAENAEHLPFVADHFDALTCVFLFHELPHRERRKVLGEMHRVLRPGGLLLISDSGQRTESPELHHFAAWFQKHFHEPYIEDYYGDDLAEMTAAAGFQVEEVQTHFVSKLVVARKV